MKQEIRTYLEKHGERYTPEALRARLIEAGHDAREVDDALAEWRAAPASSKPDPGQRRTFRWWAFGLHVGALVLVALTILPRSQSLDYIGVGFYLFVLAVVLLLGWGLSAAIGGWILRRSSLATALIAPAISALLIGGSCLAITGGL